MAVETKNKVEAGKKVPSFSFASTKGKGKLSDYKGQYLVLYFYPRDATPGCTTEGLDFSSQIKAFTKLNASILGVSQDSIESHQKFIDKQGFQFDLISDEDGSLCSLFDVIKEKNMYGKKFMGIERSTFLISPEGKLLHEWRKVKVAGHVAEVLKTLKN